MRNGINSSKNSLNISGYHLETIEFPQNFVIPLISKQSHTQFHAARQLII